MSHKPSPYFQELCFLANNLVEAAGQLEKAPVGEAARQKLASLVALSAARQEAFFSRLSSAFITPWEREDLLALSQGFLAALQSAEALGQKLAILGPRSLGSHMDALLQPPIRSAAFLQKMAASLETARSSNAFFEGYHGVAVQDAAFQKAYFEAFARLQRQKTAPSSFWAEHLLEECSRFQRRLYRLSQLFCHSLLKNS